MDARTRAPYRCAASAVVGTECAFGQLSINGSIVAFEPRGFFNSVFAVGVVGRIVHTERRIVVVRARLRRPSGSVALHLVGDPERGQGATARVRFAGRHHAAATAALLAADYEVDQCVSWFSHAGCAG